MTHLIKFIILLLAVILPATVTAHDFELDGIYYIIDGTNATVTSPPSNNKYIGEVAIPSSVTYNGKTFSVTSIGDYAFYGCSSLTSITIPSSVTSIGEWAFNGCDVLTCVNIMDLTSWCSILFNDYDSNPLRYAHHLFLNGEEVKVLVIPNSISAIANLAFTGCSGLTSVVIPNSITTIGYAAFSNCSNLMSITMPNSVISIKENAFYETAWYKNQPDGVVYAGLIAYQYKGTMPDGTSIDIKNGTLGIAEKAFFCCSELAHVTIPNTVTTIEGAAFFNCNGLTNITIPNSVTNIGYSVFCGCSGLTSVNIPDSITIINNSTFYGCSSLTDIYIPNSVTTIDTGAFSGCVGLESITIPKSVSAIGVLAFSHCNGLSSITIPKSVTTIGDQAFSWCEKLNDVYCSIDDLSQITMGASVFFRNPKNYTERTLHVPHGSLASYQADSKWNQYFGYIEEMGLMLGDVDGDSIISIADVVELIDILQSGNVSAADYPTADVNSNGIVNIADVIELIDQLLN